MGALGACPHVSAQAALWKRVRRVIHSAAPSSLPGSAFIPSGKDHVEDSGGLQLPALEDDVLLHVVLVAVGHGNLEASDESLKEP